MSGIISLQRLRQNPIMIEIKGKLILLACGALVLAALVNTFYPNKLFVVIMLSAIAFLGLVPMKD